MTKRVLPVRQERSSRTVDRLLDATVKVLDEQGIEKTTIPRIARRAGLSPGTVYRRFQNKDALLREVCLRMLEQNYRNAMQAFTAAPCKELPLAQIVRAMIRMTLEGQRKHRGLLRALLLFTLQHPNAAFVRRSAELQRKTFDEVARMLLHKRREIRHPPSEVAIRFAMLMLGFAAQGTIILPQDMDELSRFLPNVHAEVERELPRMLLRFLGVED
ncbi:MAG: TetR/AcrR family transcriptional regulator [Chthoniobacterales bacterium]